MKKKSIESAERISLRRGALGAIMIAGAGPLLTLIADLSGSLVWPTVTFWLGVLVSVVYTGYVGFRSKMSKTRSIAEMTFFVSVLVVSVFLASNYHVMYGISLFSLVSSIRYFLIHQELVAPIEIAQATEGMSATIDVKRAEEIEEEKSLSPHSNDKK